MLAGSTPARGEHVSPSHISLIQIRMVMPQVGCGLTEHRLVRTYEGGYIWHAIPVPTMLNANVGFAVHGTAQLCLVAPIHVRQGPPRSLVLSTVDGGSRWRRSRPIRGLSSSISWISSRDNRSHVL